jgi:hypothetical protein
MLFTSPIFVGLLSSEYEVPFGVIHDDGYKPSAEEDLPGI